MASHPRRDTHCLQSQKHLQGNTDAFSTLMTARSLSDQHLPQPLPGISLARMHLTLASNRASATQPLQDCPPIQTTNIGHWTDLADNTTASHLLSLYFTWDNPTWHLIDQELFLRDLERGQTGFCSALLVHALLFFGCVIALPVLLCFSWVTPTNLDDRVSLTIWRDSRIEGRRRFWARRYIRPCNVFGMSRKRSPVFLQHNPVS